LVTFENECHNYYKNLDITQSWENWQLNCLWAYSRFNNYEPLIEMLKKPELNKFNKDWAIQACEQMLKEETDERIRKKLNRIVHPDVL